MNDKLLKQKKLIENTIRSIKHLLELEWNTLRFVPRKGMWKNEIEESKILLEQLQTDLENCEENDGE